MSARLRELAERWKESASLLSECDTAFAYTECAAELLDILDAEGEGHYSQGVCEDGAAILLDGKRMTVDEIVAALNAKGAEGNDWVVGAWQYRRKTYSGWGNWKELNPEHMGAALDREGVEIRALYAPTQENQVDKCGVCDGPNAYDQESGVCLKCQDVTEGDGVAVGYVGADNKIVFYFEDGWSREVPPGTELFSHAQVAMSGVVTNEKVEECIAIWNSSPSLGRVEDDAIAMRAALEHFAKGERHER